METKTNIPIIQVHYLGLQEYQLTYQKMRSFNQERQAETPDEIWFLQHPPVYTLGLAADPSNLLNFNAQIPLIQTDRGGEITYHGPGQIIAYVLLDLKRRPYFAKELVFRIEQAVMNTLASYQVQVERKMGAPGLYIAKHDLIDPKFHGAKIAALGLKIAKKGSYHGVALNVDMDLEPFKNIHPCGYVGLKTVDMRTLGISENIEIVSKQLCNDLLQQLNY